MDTSISDVMSALEQLLLEHFKSINTGSASEPFLAFELGTPIPDETFRNPADTTLYSPALALEYLSHRANSVPSIQQRLFVETSDTVDGLYELLLRGSTPVDAASLELLGSIKRSAAAAFEGVLQVAGGSSQQFHPTHGDPANWYDQSVAANWTPIKVSRADQPPVPVQQPAALAPSLLQWKLAPVELRSQLSQSATLATISATAVAPVARPHLQAQIRAVPGAFQQARAAHFAAELRPAAAEIQAVRIDPAIQVAFASQHMRRRAVAHAHADLAAIPAPIVQPPMPVPPPPPVPPPVAADSFSISVEISIVKLRRPWLSDGLLNLNGWFVPSAAKGSFSAGTGADDAGILPLLPVAVVLIRNLAIHAQWSETDRQNLENSSHLGAFGLQGRSYDSNSATLTVPGMQSVAWICDPLPVLPPADAPAN